MRTYKIYSAVSNASNIANVTLAKGGRIKNIRWTLAIDGITDNGSYYLELSTNSSGQQTVSNSQGDIDTVAGFTNLVTSGMYPGGQHISRPGMDYPVAAGERLYLNCSLSGTIAGYAYCYIDIQE